MSLPDLVLYLGAWNAKKIAEAGGPEAWHALSATEQSERDARLMKEIVTTLGKQAYDALSLEDRRQLDLFIWAVCCMHKDMNSFQVTRRRCWNDPRWEFPAPFFSRTRITPPF
jgi:hypothetical protein